MNTAIILIVYAYIVVQVVWGLFQSSMSSATHDIYKFREVNDFKDKHVHLILAVYPRKWSLELSRKHVQTGRLVRISVLTLKFNYEFWQPPVYADKRLMGRALIIHDSFSVATSAWRYMLVCFKLTSTSCIGNMSNWGLQCSYILALPKPSVSIFTLTNMQRHFKKTGKWPKLFRH